MELGRILEEEALSKKIQEISFSQLVEEKDRISRIYSWCARRRDGEICSELERVLTDAVRSLMRLRIFKAIMGLDPGKSFDSEILKMVAKIQDIVIDLFKSIPIDPYGRVPIRSKVDLEGEGLSLRRGYIYMIHLDHAMILIASGLAEPVYI
ncbi:MAG: hypothetical protein QXE01_10765 [Sulfolobales archaeon]